MYANNCFAPGVLNVTDVSLLKSFLWTPTTALPVLAAVVVAVQQMTPVPELLFLEH